MQDFQESLHHFHVAYAELAEAQRAMLHARLTDLTPPSGGMSAASVRDYMDFMYPDFVSVDPTQVGEIDEIDRLVQLLAQSRTQMLSACQEKNWTLPSIRHEAYDAFCALAWMPPSQCSEFRSHLIEPILAGATLYGFAAGLALRLEMESNSPIISDTLATLRRWAGEDLYYGCMALGTLLKRVGKREYMDELFVICRAAEEPETRAIPEDFFI